MLVACGGSHDEDHHDGDHTIDTAGRLVTIENGATAVRVHDLDSTSAAVEATHTVDHVPAAVYPSPAGRHAVVLQRTQNQVQFIDGGVFQEDHGDHLHDQRQASRLLAWKLPGVRPTHYDLQAGKQAAIFMDGHAAASSASPAGVRLITEAGLRAGRVDASLDLGAPLHGLGEPVDDKLLTVSRATDAPDTLPTHLDLWRREGATWSRVSQVPTRCDGMHGSFSSGNHTVTGCLDGVLVVRHTGTTTVDEGRKLATPLRVGTIAGHPRLPDQYLGIATDGVAPAPVTTRFYAIDAVAGTAQALVPSGWETGRVRRAHAFDRSGQRFFLLDDQGTLTVMQRQAGAWAPLARVTGAVPAMPSAAPWPALVANGAKDLMYLTDPVARQLVVIDATTGAVRERRDLGYVPAAATWLGIFR
jgi:hypothetical protein